MKSRRHLVRESKLSSLSYGFTIVELLIVIVVIGILAAITIVAYNGISQRATAASMNADLANASKQLKLYQVTNSSYPINIDCSASPAANTICLKSSSGTTYTSFTPSNTGSVQTFCLTAANGTTNYFINDTIVASPTAGQCSDVSGVVGWWPLNGNVNDSTNGINGTVTGATLTTGQNGQSNGAYSFNGTSNYITLANTSALSLSASDLSLSAWVNMSVVPGATWYDIFSSNYSDWSVGVNGSSGNARLQMTNVSVYDAPASSQILSATTWYHVVTTFSTSTKLVTYYVNGQSAGGGTWTNVGSFTPGTKTIGARNSGTSGFFKGAIDDVRVFNRVLSLADVQGLYATGGH